MRDGLKRLYWRLIQLILTSETCIWKQITGLDHKDDDWLNLIGFGNKIFECFGNIKTAISKKLIDIA